MRLFIFCWAILCLFQIIQSGKSENNINRIVGGYPTEKDQLPYQVSLRIQNHHICGGAIISNQHVLTAAHCVMKGEDDDVDTVYVTCLIYPPSHTEGSILILVNFYRL